MKAQGFHRSRSSCPNGTGLTAISLFTGAMGLDLGLEEAGFRTRVAVEVDPDAVATIRANRPDIPIIRERIEGVSPQEILEAARLKVGEATLVAGGPACQSFSTAGKRKSLATKSGLLTYQFMRVVDEVRPEFFLMENVRGLLSAAIKHRPLIQRGPGCPALSEDEELGSAFRALADRIKEIGYYTVFGVLNAADYGVPQTRQRLVLIGSREGKPVAMPPPSHCGGGGGGLPAWQTLRDALEGLAEAGEGRQFVPSRKHYLHHVPPGGNWRDLPENLKRSALGGAYVSWGGRTGFLRRLGWDQPSPTLNTDPDQKATSLCHPDEDRPLSIPEYARIQGFPAGWTVFGGMASKYRQLGNAVPVGLAQALGTAIRTAKRGNARRERLGRVECHDLALLDSLVGRSRTRLNPPRMRLPTGQHSDRWNDGKPPLRDDGSAFAPPHLMGAVGKTKTAKKIAEKLKALYGASDRGGFEDPVDKLFFILLSQRSVGSTYERVFSSFKEWAFDWDAMVHGNATDLVEAAAKAGLGPRKSGYVLAIADLLHRKFGRVTLEPLKTRPDAEMLTFLTTLPGVGLKTAKSVMMFNMNREVLPVDAHVARVAGRIGLLDPSASGFAHC